MDMVRDTRLAAEATETVICYPSGEYRTALWLAASFGAMSALGGLLALVTWSNSIWCLLGLGFLLFGPLTFPLGIWAALYLSRAAIIADAEGLRYRGAGRWRVALWKDVVNYYDYWPTSDLKRPLAKVQTRSGTLIFSAARWTNAVQFRSQIAQRATGSSLRGWQPYGGPADKLPLRCHYATAVNRNILSWMDNLHKYGLLAVAIYFALRWFTTHTLPGWGWLLTPTGLFVIAKQTLPLLLRPTYRATQPRLKDQVFADKHGLRFVDTNGETVIPWEDVTDFYTDGMRSVIVTTNGEYDFLDTLTNTESLKAIIPQLAINAGQTAWRTGTARRRQVIQADGRQSVSCIYCYRTQDNFGRLLSLTLIVLFAVGMTLAFIAAQSIAGVNVSEIKVACLGSLGILALFWLWGNYWRGAIRTNEDGIMQQTVFGRRFLAWSQIRTFHWRGGADLSWGCVEGMSGTIKFWKGIGDADQLAVEIAGHGITVR